MVNTNVDALDTGHAVQFTVTGVHDAVSTTHILVVALAVGLIRTHTLSPTIQGLPAHPPIVAVHRLAWV